MPKPAPQQVPGSWKRASIKYRWVERVAAYDEYRIDKMVESSLDDLMKEATTTFHRVMTLKSLLEFMRVNLNENAKHMSYDQINQWIGRMQSLMRDIRSEMEEYDENVTRVLLRQQSTGIYRAYEPKNSQKPASAAPAPAPPAPSPTAEQLLAEAASAEQLLAAIRSEQKRRA